MKAFSPRLSGQPTLRMELGVASPPGVQRLLFSIPFLSMLLLAVLIFSVSTGAYPIQFADWVRLFDASDNDIEGTRYLLLHIRLPRVMLGVVAGAGLSLAGAALQGLFRNPLADPGLVGVSSGGMLFAVAGLALTTYPPVALMMETLGYTAITALAFAGSLGATWLVYRIATTGQQTRIAAVLLAGIAIAALAGALTGLLTYFSDEQRLRDITFWTLGSLSGANWQITTLTAVMMGISATMIIRQTRGLNLFLLGESEAAFAGVPVQKLKKQIIVAVALAVGACVAVCGMIGFVGLVMPHLARMGAGADHRKLLVRAALLGAILMPLADTVARTIIAPAELPIGVLTALLGAPFFLWLLLRKRQNIFH